MKTKRAPVQYLSRTRSIHWDTQLGVDIWYDVFSYLSSKDLMSIYRLNTHMCALVEHSNWYLEQVTKTVPCKGCLWPGTGGNPETDWKGSVDFCCNFRRMRKLALRHYVFRRIVREISEMIYDPRYFCLKTFSPAAYHALHVCSEEFLKDVFRSKSHVVGQVTHLYLNNDFALSFPVKLEINKQIRNRSGSWDDWIMSKTDDETDHASNFDYETSSSESEIVE